MSDLVSWDIFFLQFRVDAVEVKAVIDFKHRGGKFAKQKYNSGLAGG